VPNDVCHTALPKSIGNRVILAYKDRKNICLSELYATIGINFAKLFLILASLKEFL